MPIESFGEKPLQAKGEHVHNPFSHRTGFLSRGQNWQVLMKCEGRVTPAYARHSGQVRDLKPLVEQSDA